MSLTIRFGQTPYHRGTPLDTRIRAAIRRCLGDEVERLLAILDGLDVDTELEPAGDDEPSLCILDGASGNRHTSTDDREEDAGDEGEPDEDREPALGWTADGHHGDGWIWCEEEDEA